MKARKMMASQMPKYKRSLTSLLWNYIPSSVLLSLELSGTKEGDSVLIKATANYLHYSLPVFVYILDCESVKEVKVSKHLHYMTISGSQTEGELLYQFEVTINFSE